MTSGSYDVPYFRRAHSTFLICELDFRTLPAATRSSNWLRHDCIIPISLEVLHSLKDYVIRNDCRIPIYLWPPYSLNSCVTIAEFQSLWKFHTQSRTASQMHNSILFRSTRLNQGLRSDGIIPISFWAPHSLKGCVMIANSKLFESSHSLKGCVTIAEFPSRWKFHTHARGPRPRERETPILHAFDTITPLQKLFCAAISLDAVD